MPLDAIQIPTQSVPSPFNRIAFVAEAPGKEEMKQGSPLVGASGQEHSRILRDAGINRTECVHFNLFNFKLPGNQVSEVCGTKKQMPKGYDLKPIEPSRYVRPEYLIHRDRLRDEIISAKPHVIVALGNSALWAVCGVTGIKSLRGAVGESTLCPGIKVIPTYHPAAILRMWDWRITVLADYIKAKHEAEFPEIRRPHREVWLWPTIEDLYEYERKYIIPCKYLSIDIETEHGFVKCIGFAPDPYHAIVVPFVNKRGINYSYWGTLEEELQAYIFCEALLASQKSKIYQNGVYDILWKWLKMKIKTLRADHDTMLLHHSLYPEMEKSLGFMGSIYTNEVSWKLWRPRGNKAEVKDDE